MNKTPKAEIAETATVTIPRLKSDFLCKAKYDDSPQGRQRDYENNCIANAIKRGAKDVAESLRGDRRKKIVKLLAEQVNLQNRLLELRDELNNELAAAAAAL